MAKRISVFLLLLVLAAAVACSSQRAGTGQNTGEMKDNVERSLQQAGMNNVKVDLDHEKKVVTLNGKVDSADKKDHAAEAAKTAAPGYVIANEISVEPAGAEGQARKIEGNLDDAIESNFKAALVGNQMDKLDVDYKANNGVLTLTGKVDNMAQREQVEKLAASIPNVQQVVNKLDVKERARR